MNSFAYWLAWRYLLGSAYEKTISYVTIICFCALLIGSCALALITAITSGFEKATKKTLQNIHPHIIIHLHDDENFDKKKFDILLHTHCPHIVSWSPSSSRYGILEDDEESRDGQPYIVTLEGIDPLTRAQVSSLQQTIIQPRTKNIADIIHDNQVFIGTGIAHQWDLQVGDSCTFLFPEEQQKKNRITFDKTSLVVGGIFKTGIEEFDNNLIFCAYDFFEDLFPNTHIEQLNLHLFGEQYITESVTALKTASLDAHAWYDAYPALMAALKLETYVAFAILSLTTLVASMNIIALLFMHIIRKRPDIAILKTLGCSTALIRHIFLCMGLIISLAASTFGLLLAAGISYLLEQYHLISLPDAYYVSHLPADMTITMLFSVFGVVMLLSFFATLIPLCNIRTINVSQILRFEG
ncbi:MAG TPA: FtsX-like permease family protein [Candidatus Bathyarchaeia archaeon]|nr:FtsX-like permease family protein [Candidatus Bathyarchaeia archaeon]